MYLIFELVKNMTWPKCGISSFLYIIHFFFYLDYNQCMLSTFLNTFLLAPKFDISIFQLTTQLSKFSLDF